MEGKGKGLYFFNNPVKIGLQLQDAGDIITLYLYEQIEIPPVGC